MLHLCTRHPDKKGLQYLIKHFGIGATSNSNDDDDDGEGGGIDVQDRNKRTPLHWAASQVSSQETINVSQQIRKLHNLV